MKRGLVNGLWKRVEPRSEPDRREGELGGSEARLYESSILMYG
jgi:hypothetical protein